MYFPIAYFPSWLHFLGGAGGVHVCPCMSAFTLELSFPLNSETLRTEAEMNLINIRRIRPHVLMCPHASLGEGSWGCLQEVEGFEFWLGSEYCQWGSPDSFGLVVPICTESPMVLITAAGTNEGYMKVRSVMCLCTTVTWSQCKCAWVYACTAPGAKKPCTVIKISEFCPGINNLRKKK